MAERVDSSHQLYLNVTMMTSCVAALSEDGLALPAPFLWAGRAGKASGVRRREKAIALRAAPLSIAQVAGVQYYS
jgi:hypothetical protein